jgi:glucose/arabinose dehydrogenase
VISLWGLMDVVVHPKFVENRLVYLSYMKPLATKRPTLAIARGRYDGKALLDVQEIFVASPPSAASSRLAFGLDGHLYVTTTSDDMRAQDPNEYGGKILRLREDGTVPPDNPFVKRPGSSRRSICSDTAVRSDSPCTPTRVPSGRPSTDAWAATRST